MIPIKTCPQSGQANRDKEVYVYSGRKAQFILASVFIPCAVILMWASAIKLINIDTNEGWFGTIVMVATLFATGVWGLNVALNRPFVRRIRINDGGLISISYIYAWGRLSWTGTSDLVRRVVVIGPDGGGMSNVCLSIEMRDKSWFCLGDCKGNLFEAKKMQEAMKLDSVPTMETGDTHDELASYFKARKVFRKL